MDSQETEGHVKLTGNIEPPEETQGQVETQPCSMECADPVRRPDQLYSPLDITKKAVRFLKIRPAREGRGEDQIECSMVSTTLDVEYHAVSYVWGSSAGSKEILVNGHTISATRNLHDLLTSFRTNTKMLQYLLWVDAICINQEDLDERSDQVRMMGEIYSGAATVHIWMGWPTQNTRALSKRMDDIPHYMDSGAAISAIVDEDELWEEFRRLTDHDWFTRVWVIQEAVLAKVRAVWCGSNVILLDNILNSGYALADAAYHGMVGIKRDVDQQDIWKLQGRLTKFNPSSYQTAHIWDVMIMFTGAQFSKCTDPRDHMYGLLSLLPPSIPWIINYNLPMPEVYATGIFQLMEWSNSLEPLRLRQPRSVDPTLPSWVPDLTRVSLYANNDLGAESEAYNACASATFFGVYTRPAELQVHALEVDTITALHPYALLKTDSEPPLGSPGYDEERYMRKVLKRWRGMAVKFIKDDRDPLTTEIALWEAIATDRLPGNYPQSTDTSTKGYVRVDAEMARGLYEWLYAPEGDPKAEMNSKLRSIFRLRVMGNVWFVTGKGRMGSLYGDCKVGDTVAVLAGLSRPVVLRKADGDETEQRQFVSTCYCDGIMHGEAVREAAHSGTGLEDRIDEVFAEIKFV